MKIIFTDIFKPICYIYILFRQLREIVGAFFTLRSPRLSQITGLNFFTVAEQPTTLEASIQKVGAKRKNLILGYCSVPIGLIFYGKRAS
jgi:hypothetical protein